MFSNNNYHLKNTVIENSVFSGLARGDFAACIRKLLEGLEWNLTPWEIAVSDQAGYSDKVSIGDIFRSGGKVDLVCGSATELTTLADVLCDFVITDSLFGGLMQYAELSDFFYVWLRLVLLRSQPEMFASKH